MTPIEVHILEYLKEHPRASDTVEGVTAWWLPGVRPSFNLQAVRESLEQLVSSGLLSSRVDSSGRAHYRLNQRHDGLLL